MSAETQPTCRPTSTDAHVGRHGADTSPPLGRHLADTLPTLGNTTLTWSTLVTPSSPLSGAFSDRRHFLAFHSGNILLRRFAAMFFPLHRFYIRPSLLFFLFSFLLECCDNSSNFHCPAYE